MNTIGWAIEQLYQGRRVRRPGWNGKGMWLAHVGQDWFGQIGGSAVGAIPEESKGTAQFIVILGADKYLVPWSPSQADQLATDWEIAS